ncbi:MAG TPA: DUF1127 domain-containing protein [Burkholderiaceae bacterium]|nr:DUF1127 domain-containing protein [Burkholderiaceae bacterium]
METTLCRPVPVSRAVWLRLGDGVLDALAAVYSALRRLWGRWRAARRRAAEFRALRELSPSVLRDIGAEPEMLQQVQRWRERYGAAHDNFLRAP